MPFNMADIPLAPQDIEAKLESSEDGKPGTLEMSQDEVDAIIRNKRKVRDPKACYACHRRKVKCDRNLPCDSCVKRDHPELCSYERPTKKRRIALSSALAQAEGGHADSSHSVANTGPKITVPKEQWERLNQELAQLRHQAIDEKEDNASAATEERSTSGLLSSSDDPDRGGVHAPSNQMGTMHLGSRSVLAYMLGNRTKSTQDAARTLLEKDILPNLGLDNQTTTYPFVDLWSTDSSMQDVSGLLKALPDDSLCREFFLTYRDIPCIIYPVVPDADAFEHNLNVLLRNRAESMARGVETDPNRPYGVSMPWLSLLFAVLASGSQSTSRPAKERELTSQVYICCSYQALRMSNFLTHPCLETIQALLIIGNALSYNMNPGVSYIILGMTLRSAFSMGLHVHSPTFSEHENYLRSRIWWALAWQDSHFSVSYDRPSSSILCLPNLPFTKFSTPGKRSYVESMTSIIKLTQKILRERALNPKHAMSWNMIVEFKEEVHRIWREAAPRLRDPVLCVLMVDHLERLALQIHCSYLISEICRPALGQGEHPASDHTSRQLPIVSPTSTSRRKSSLSAGSPATTPSDPQLIADLRKECVHFLRRTVETYTELRLINKFAARSWIGIQRAISAAFLLGVLPDTQREAEVIALLTDLEKAIQESAMEDGILPSSSDNRSPQMSTQPAVPLSAEQLKESPMWMRSMTKSLNALSKLNATLAGGRAGDQPRHPRPPMFQPMMAQQAAAMYNTPVVSPTSSTSVPSLPMMQQFNFPPSDGNTPMSMGAPPPQMPSLGPYTPDSTASDWNFGNLPQHALGYIHTGIWGN